MYIVDLAFRVTFGYPRFGNCSVPALPERPNATD